jgi:ABC-type Fe3+/spermidine/putrescine transport system ATPase subunit
MTHLRLTDLHKAFPYQHGSLPVLTGLELAVESGELVAIVGPSGTGKSTLLRLIAGLLVPDRGDVLFDGQSMLKIPPEKRKAALVFQENQLFPFMTVAQNIAFGLKIQRLGRATIQARVAEMLDLVQLSDYGERYPQQLSGGQQQRVALARALAIRPRLWLLDEPLSQLDAELRQELRQHIKGLQQQFGITTLFVTHDQSEAVALADRIALMLDGQIRQIGPANVFFEQPHTPQVARFWGASNLIPAIKCGRTIRVGDLQLTIAPSLLADGPVMAMLRPEALQVGANGANTLTGVVDQWQYEGHYSRGIIHCGEIELTLRSTPFLHLQPHDSIQVHIASEHIWLMPMEDV